MSRRRILAALPALAAGLLAATPAATAAPPAARQAVPTLVRISAAHHSGFDRLVFEFRGGLPADRGVHYVPGVIGDPSGRPIPVAGSAFLEVRFSPATGHDEQGHGTYGPTRRRFGLPAIVEVVNSGDFEAVLRFGVGLTRRSPVRAFTLSGPARLVVDVGTPACPAAARGRSTGGAPTASGDAAPPRPTESILAVPWVPGRRVA